MIAKTGIIGKDRTVDRVAVFKIAAIDGQGRQLHFCGTIQIPLGPRHRYPFENIGAGSNADGKDGAQDDGADPLADGNTHNPSGNDCVGAAHHRRTR